MIENLEGHIEALIFSSAQSISVAEITHTLNAALELDVTEPEVLTYIGHISNKYEQANLSISLEALNGGYQFLTRKAFHHTINQLQIHRAKKRLSQAAMETLAIIAYKQPITKLEIEQIRGVNSDYSVQRLLEKDLISMAGKSEGPGRPILYKTSETFMDYFALNNISDLPQLKDLHKEENAIGVHTE